MNLIFMPFGSAVRDLSHLARIALAALLLVAVPMTDAFTCDAETSSAPVAVEMIAIGGAGTDSPAHGGQSVGEAQHCHHCIPLGSDTEAMRTFTDAPARFKPHGAAIVLTRVAGGLERPPRI